MIGRAAMTAPWIFRQTKHYLATGELLPAPTLDEKWALIRKHCTLHVENWGDEDKAMRAMRARLMAYAKGMPSGKALRERFQHVATLQEIDVIASEHIATVSADDGGSSFGETLTDGVAGAPPSTWLSEPAQPLT
jgi:tRNA-dihydrouridine synthase